MSVSSFIKQDTWPYQNATDNSHIDNANLPWSR